MSEGIKALYPHTARDLLRAGLTILLVGIVFLGIGYRFYIGEDPTDPNAAIMIWVVGIGLIVIGSIVIATRKKKGAPEGSEPIA